MRVYYLIVPLLVLAACAPQLPESGAGSDNGNDTYIGPPAPASTGTPPIDPLINPNAISTEDVSGTSGAAPDGPNSSTRLPLPFLAPTDGTAATPLAAPIDRAQISDEQDFNAVTARETIESDAQRRAAQQQVYQTIQPTALPTRSGKAGPSIVEFALSTSNAVGQSLYRRNKILAQNRFDRNCAKYPSSDLAQEAFLKAGGPKVDRYGMDPDGDGFACYWDPAPFRLAVSN
jgi:hypothetical protein